MAVAAIRWVCEWMHGAALVCGVMCFGREALNRPRVSSLTTLLRVKQPAHAGRPCSAGLFAHCRHVQQHCLVVVEPSLLRCALLACWVFVFRSHAAWLQLFRWWCAWFAVDAGIAVVAVRQAYAFWHSTSSHSASALRCGLCPNSGMWLSAFCAGHTHSGEQPPSPGRTLRTRRGRFASG